MMTSSASFLQSLQACLLFWWMGCIHVCTYYYEDNTTCGGRTDRLLFSLTSLTSDHHRLNIYVFIPTFTRYLIGCIHHHHHHHFCSAAFTSNNHSSACFLSHQRTLTHAFSSAHFYMQIRSDGARETRKRKISLHTS
jgi:hypothetical protein